MDDFAGAAIFMAEDDAEPLLGRTTLESVGIAMDPESYTLKKKPRLRMPGIRLIPDHPAANR